jgi:hypothetical protein
MKMYNHYFQKVAQSIGTTSHKLDSLNISFSLSLGPKPHLSPKNKYKLWHCGCLYGTVFIGFEVYGIDSVWKRNVVLDTVL